MTISYVATQGSIIWMFGLPMVYVLLLGIINYCHKILHTSIDLDQPEIRFDVKEMSPFQNTPANRTLIFLLILSAINYLLPVSLLRLSILCAVVLAPAWMILLSLQNNLLNAFKLNLWFELVGLLGKHYWVLLASSIIISYQVYSYLLVDGSFINFILAIYLILFFHRFAGLILRHNESLTLFPRHWQLSDKAKTAVLHEPKILKYQRIIQGLKKSESNEVFDEKLLLLMKRSKYQDAQFLFKALILLDSPIHAIHFCYHYLIFLVQNYVDDINQLKSTLKYCFQRDDTFLLPKDMQNVLLVGALFNNRLHEEALKICDNFINQRIESDFTAQIIKLKAKIETHPSISNDLK